MTSAAVKNQLDYQESLPVHLLNTRNSEGEHCYFVVRASRAHLVQMLAKKGERVDIDAYGEILASGYGEHPNAQVIAMLKTRYNVELPVDGEQ